MQEASNQDKANQDKASQNKADLTKASQNLTLNELYRRCVQIISTSSDTPTLDARIIAQNVLNVGLNSFILHSQDLVKPADFQRTLDLAQRRAQGEPVAYLVGHRGFYEEDFKVNSSTLIPRADTEILVEEAIKQGLEIAQQENKQELKILDLCTGTGCVGISVAKALFKRFAKTTESKTTESKTTEYRTKLTLSDISKDALQVCKENAKRILGNIGLEDLEYEVLCGDLFERVAGKKFDLILANPPYIKTEVIQTLEEQVKREPILALDGGADGLALIKKLTNQAPKYLEKGGALLLEIGYDQGDAVKALFEKAGFKQVEVKKDLGGCDRVVKGAL
jgi:release factor glutamine methyltransferase